MLNPQWRCLYQEHKGEKIQLFCFDDQCRQEFLCCPQCAAQRHPHKSNCLTKQQVIDFISNYKLVSAELLGKLYQEKEQILKKIYSTEKFYQSLLEYLDILEKELLEKKFQQLKLNANFFKEMYRSSFSLSRLLYDVWEVIEPLSDQMKTFRKLKLPWKQDESLLQQILQEPNYCNKRQRLEYLYFSGDIPTTIEFHPKIFGEKFQFFSCDRTIPQKDYRAQHLQFDNNPYNYLIGVCQKNIHGDSLSLDQIKNGNYGLYVVDKNGSEFSENMQPFGFQKISNHFATNIVMVEIDRIFNRLNLHYLLERQRQETFTIHNLPPTENLFLCVGLQFGKCKLIQPPIYWNQK